MRKFIGGLLFLSLALLQPQLAVAKDKYFYNKQQCDKLGLIPGKRLVEVEEMFQGILEYSGLKGNYYLCPTQFFSEAFAFDPASMENRVSIKGQYIGYDSNFIQNMRNKKVGYWSVYGILAHELAHHKLGHTASGRGSNPGTELRADRMAGELMQKSGASLADTISLPSMPFLQDGGRTHPSGAKRVVAFKGGWISGCQQKPSHQCPGFKRTKETVVDDKNYAETAGFLQLRRLAEKYKGASVTQEYCNLYASVGVKQTQRNKQHQCGYLVDASNNSRWSLDFAGQFNWCKVASAYATDKETRFREKQLKTCLAK